MIICLSAARVQDLKYKYIFKPNFIFFSYRDPML